MSKERRIKNYRPIALIDMAVGDEYYVQKLKSGFMYSARCKLVKIERGIVHGEVVEHYVSRGHRVPNDMEVGQTLKARANKCYLWGKQKEDELFARCIWFKNAKDAI